MDHFVPDSCPGLSLSRYRAPRRRQNRWSCCLLALLLVCSDGCASFRQYLGAHLVSFETEVRLGEKLAVQIEQQQRVLRDSDLQAYVRFVTERLATHAARDRPEVVYRVRVLDDPRQINAFALPAGFLYVYSGLLLAAENEAELAGILAHEIGHVVGRHSANQLATQVGLEILAGIALGQNSEELAVMAADLGTSGALARFSRDDERQADEFGVRYTIAAGYDPRGLLTFFEKLEKVEGPTRDGLESLLASHPATAERIERLNRLIHKAGNPRGDTARRRYREATARLRRAHSR